MKRLRPWLIPLLWITGAIFQQLTIREQSALIAKQDQAIRQLSAALVANMETLQDCRLRTRYGHVAGLAVTQAVGAK